jgi:prevent-host-death family protein
MGAMSTPISATEAARRFSDLLNRVRYRGEKFVIVRNGEEVAELSAVAPRPGVTLAEAVDRLIAARSGDPDFADDLERIQAGQPLVGEGPWTS